MTHTAGLLLVALAVLALAYILRWWKLSRTSTARAGGPPTRPLLVGVGFAANFFDTLGIGSFAPTTAAFKLFRLVGDELIPGTLNAGHALPTMAQALIFISIVTVDPLTLISMIAAAVFGAWLGTSVVAKFSNRAIQISMGGALLVAAILFASANLGWIPGGGTATALRGSLLAVAVGVNALLGAFLMPVAGMRIVASGRFDSRAALGLALGGIPGVLLAAYVVKSLPLLWLRWLVVSVVLYAAAIMLHAARRTKAEI